MESIAVNDVAPWLERRAVGVDRFVFGLAGPPGSGKSTIAERLSEDLGAPIVSMDGFHLPNATLAERGLSHVKGSPITFAADEFVDLVHRLGNRAETVSAPIFDRVVDEPIPGGVEISARHRMVIVEGNYLLLDEPPWSLLALDAVGYVDIPREVRVERLIARHVSYGRSIEDATAFVRRSDERNSALVEANRDRADLLVTAAY